MSQHDSISKYLISAMRIIIFALLIAFSNSSSASKSTVPDCKSREYLTHVRVDPKRGEVKMVCAAITEKMKSEEQRCLSTANQELCLKVFEHLSPADPLKLTVAKLLFKPLKESCASSSILETCENALSLGMILNRPKPFPESDLSMERELSFLRNKACQLAPQTGQRPSMDSVLSLCPFRFEAQESRGIIQRSVQACKALPGPGPTSKPIDECRRTYEQLAVYKPKEAEQLYKAVFAEAELECRKSGTHCAWLAASLSDKFVTDWQSTCERAPSDHPLRNVYCLLATKSDLLKIPYQATLATAENQIGARTPPTSEPKTCPKEFYLGHPPRGTLPISLSRSILLNRPRACLPFTEQMISDRKKCLTNEELVACENAYNTEITSNRDAVDLHPKYSSSLRKSCQTTKTALHCRELWQISIQPTQNIPFWQKNLVEIRGAKSAVKAACEVDSVKATLGQAICESIDDEGNRIQQTFALKACANINATSGCYAFRKNPSTNVPECEPETDARTCMNLFEVYSVDKPEEAEKLYQEKFKLAESECRTNGPRCKWLLSLLKKSPSVTWKKICAETHLNHPLRKLYCLLSDREI